MKVLIVRGSGDRQVTINDPVISNLTVARLTGETIIDRDYTDRSTVTIETVIPSVEDLVPGMFVAVELFDGTIMGVVRRIRDRFDLTGETPELAREVQIETESGF